MRKFLCGILAFIICSISIVSFAEEQSGLQNQQQDLKNKIEKSTGDLNKVEDELTENLQQIQKLDEKIYSSQEEVNKLDNEINKLQNSVNQIEKELKVEEKKYKAQEQLLNKRLVTIYEAGDTNYLDVLLSSKNISEFLSNYFLITEIVSYDTQLLEEVAEKKNEIDIQKQKLENQQQELGTKKQTVTKTAKIIENTKVLKESYRNKLSEEEKAIQAQIDEYNLKFAEINSQILELARSGIDTKYIGGELAWPVPGYTTVTSEYGMRTHPITGVYKLHTGVDISAPTGAEFVAANDGIVIKAEYNSAYGNMVIVDHGGGVATLYAHGSEILVSVGQIVKRNQSVLKVGSTGYSTGPHAHFEVRLDGITTDPIPYITNGLIPKET